MTPSLSCFVAVAVAGTVLVLVGGGGAGPLAETAGEAGATAAVDLTGCDVDGHLMTVGEVFNTGPEPCNTYTCYAPGTIHALTCAYWTAGEGCEIVPGNLSSVYPHCCPVESCNDNLINVDTK